MSGEVDLTNNEAQKAYALLRIAQKRFGELIRSLPSGIIVAAVTGRIEAVNPAVLTLFDYTGEEMLGMDLTKLFSEAPWKNSTNLDSWLLENPEQTNELFAKTSLEEPIPVDVSLRVLQSDGVRRIIVVIQDVTERFLANELKEEFLQMIHHDIRSPLTSLVLFLESLEKSDQYGTLTEGGAQRLINAKKNVKRVLNLLSGVLELDRLESGRAALKTEKIDTDKLVAEALNSVIELASAKNIELVTSCQNVEVVADPTRIVQVMVNLVSNAIDQSVNDKPIIIACQQAGEMMRFSVDDNGPGVPEKDKSKIFERFSRGAKEAKGFGLGLAICTAIVKEHAGKIGCLDSPTGGSIFWFEIPLGI